MDILIPLGSGSRYQNSELRFALRSIEKFATGFDRIFIVGKDPGFLSDKVQFFEKADATGYNKEYRISEKVLWAFQSTDVSNEVAFWNDDFVLTKPVNVREIDYFQDGQLRDIAERKKKQKYGATLLATHTTLVAAGRPALNYEIHCPIIYQRDKFIGLQSWWTASKESKQGFCAKSIYSNNVLPAPGPAMKDIKLKDFDMAVAQIAARDRWVFSYGARAFGNGMKNFLETMFPEKSSYERY
jgi:hypothetical protein